MTYGAMYITMKKLLPTCGMTKEEAGCHSYRRGTATGLAHINAPSYAIKGIGIWGSDAYLGCMISFDYFDLENSRQHKSAVTTAGDHDITYHNHNENIPCGL